MNVTETINLITALWLGFMGACVGSFLNVVAYRVPLGKSVVWEPSQCPRCRHKIRPYDNVPVLGWLWLRGRCRDCGGKISPRYAIVEAIMGGATFLLAYVELFPGDASADRTGAADIVWNPHWPTIGLYALHCLVASFVMTMVLFRLDKNISSGKFVTSLVIAAILWWLALAT